MVLLLIPRKLHHGFLTGPCHKFHTAPCPDTDTSNTIGSTRWKIRPKQQGLEYPSWIYCSTFSCSRPDSKLPALHVTWYRGIHVWKGLPQEPKVVCCTTCCFIVVDGRCSHLLPWRRYSGLPLTTGPLKTSYRSSHFGFSSYLVIVGLSFSF